MERAVKPKNSLARAAAVTKTGEDVSQPLDVIPTQLRVLVTRRQNILLGRICAFPVKVDWDMGGWKRVFVNTVSPISTLIN